MPNRPLSVLVFAFTLLLCAAAVCAAPVDGDVADRIAEAWARRVAGPEAGAEFRFHLEHEGAAVARVYALEPAGYAVVPLRDELAPVTAHGTLGDPADRLDGGFFDLIARDLSGRLAVLADKAEGELPRHPAWDRLTSAVAAPAALDAIPGVGPLLESTWHQGWPFNVLCPYGAGGRTYVGCTPLAAAQLLYYYRWPLRGEGSRSYWWSGDDACGGSTGATLSADFVEPYEWDAMTDAVNWLSPPETQTAVAELCYDVAVACGTDFSYCGSSAALSQALYALTTHFRFKSTAREQMRFRYSDDSWFTLLRNEIDAGRPALYSTIIHTMVVDGWREDVDLRQIHINYGWEGESDDWYTLDAIETSYNPQTERVIVGLEPDTLSPVTITRFEVSRQGVFGRLLWRVEGLLDASSFNVWRGTTVDDRVCLTDTPITGAGDIVWVDDDAPLGETWYWLQEMIVGAPSTWAGPVKLAAVDDTVTRVFVMEGSNPFNPRAVLRFALAADGPVELSVFDLAGRRVADLVDGSLSAGTHRAIWDGRDAAGRHAPSGIYLARLRADGRVSTLRLTLAR